MPDIKQTSADEWPEHSLDPERSKEPRTPRIRGGHRGKPKPPRANEFIEIGFAGLAMVFLCLGSWFYLTRPASASLSVFVPAGAALAVFFVVKAWPSLSFDQSTLVGLTMMMVGSIFSYLAVQTNNPVQKSDYKDLGLLLLSGGAGIFVGQRLPPATKQRDDNEDV